MSSYRASSKITMHGGATHYSVERVDQVVKERDGALGSNALMELESTAIPTGQKFYLDPSQIESIRRVE